MNTDTTETVPSNLANTIAMLASNKEIKNYFKWKWSSNGFGYPTHKIGSKWVNNDVYTNQDGSVLLKTRSDAPKAVNDVVLQFNEKPQVVLHRTHGRTTIAERLEMAKFAKCISLELIAKKFAVSIPTVSIYANKYGSIV